MQVMDLIPGTGKIKRFGGRGGESRELEFKVILRYITNSKLVFLGF